MDVQLLKNLWDKHEAHQAERERVSMQVLSTLLIASATILAVSVTLRGGAGTPGDTGSLLHVLCISTMVVNALCILSLGVALYGYVVLANSFLKGIQDQIQDILDHPDAKTVVDVSTKVPKVFSICEKVGYASFAVFIVGLTLIGCC